MILKTKHFIIVNLLLAYPWKSYCLKLTLSMLLPVWTHPKYLLSFSDPRNCSLKLLRAAVEPSSTKDHELEVSSKKAILGERKDFLELMSGGDRKTMGDNLTFGT